MENICSARFLVGDQALSELEKQASEAHLLLVSYSVSDAIIVNPQGWADGAVLVEVAGFNTAVMKYLGEFSERGIVNQSVKQDCPKYVLDPVKVLDQINDC